jgi:spore maturation protein A
MFFILNATSIQLIPTSIISVRMALGSVAPADVALPTLIATVFSTLLGAVLCRIFIPPKKAKKTAFMLKKKGAGI